MQIAGDERLGGYTAARPDHFYGETFCAVIAFLNRHEFVHVAAGDSGNGEPDFLLRGRPRAGFWRNESHA